MTASAKLQRRLPRRCCARHHVKVTPWRVPVVAGWLATHPDFKRLVPDLGDGETVKLPTIKVDAVRDALDFMQLSASAEQGRVLLVDPATALARARVRTHC